MNYILANDPEQTEVGIVTQRGAFKKMKLKEMGLGTRARRGLMILRELKRDPHRIVAMREVKPDTLLQVLTATDQVCEIRPADYPAGDRYSNGSFVIDTDVDGKPVYVHQTQVPTPPTD